MSEATFATGQTVYTTSGQEALYVAAFEGRHLVSLVYDHCSETEEPIFDSPVLVDRVFAEAPVARISQCVRNAQQEYAKLNAEVAALRKEKTEAERSQRDRLLKLKQHAALARIEDFLDGRFKFFVEVQPYGVPKIMPKDAALAEGGVDRYDRSLKLLTLFGKSNGDFQWNISRYHDGSGHSTEVFPVETEEEGVALIRRLFADHVAGWRASADKNAWSHAARWATDLPAGTVEIPSDLGAAIRESKLKSLREKEAEAQKKLDEAQAALAKAEAVTP